MRPLLVLAAIPLLACVPAPDAGDTQAAETASDGCAITFVWLQKDAYASTAGRSSELWPPHTTTVVEVSCAGEAKATYFRENHGTKPDAIDAAGTPILVEVKRVGPVRASAERTRAFVEAYRGCECAPTTTFLSSDAIDQDKTAQLIQALASYVGQHLSCPDLHDADLASWLQQGRFDAVLRVLGGCAWDDGSDWASGWAQATAAVLGDDLARYHVCNNDAALESALFDALAAGDPLAACDGRSPLCAGPRWFYTP